METENEVWLKKEEEKVVLSQCLIVTYKIWTAEEKRVPGINDLNHNITED